MALITGQLRELGKTQKAWKNFRLSIEKNLESSVNEFVEHGMQLVETWEREVKRAVGVQLPKEKWHRRRPNPNKLFPYKNTGKQQESIKGNIKNNITGAGNFSITAWGEIAVPYASYTNVGLKSRGAPVSWEGWVDDVFDGDGRGGIISIADVFEHLSIERFVMKGFEK